jgi:hypothetical protein
MGVDWHVKRQMADGFDVPAFFQLSRRHHKSLERPAVAGEVRFARYLD